MGPCLRCSWFFLEDSFLASWEYLCRLLRLRISVSVMLVCICAWVYVCWVEWWLVSASAGKTGVAILEETYSFLFIGWF